MRQAIPDTVIENCHHIVCKTKASNLMKLPLLSTLAEGKITVLLFHKVPAVHHRLSPTELEVSGFEQVINAVMENFRILPLDEAVGALSKGKLPRGTACITFDDGYPEWVKHVAPVLERKNAHATFFVTSGQFDSMPMWNERILYAVDQCAMNLSSIDMTDLGLPILPLRTLQERQAAVRLLDGAIKYLPPTKKEEALQKLQAFTGQSTSAPRMTTGDVNHLHAKGFTIGAHSITHPILSQCDDEEAYQEIAGSREMLESIVRAPVKLFAYPNGIPGRDFGPKHVEMVRKAGYVMAFSTHSGVATRDTSPFQIPRFTPWGPSSTKMGLQLARNLMQKPRAVKENGELAKALMVAFHFPPQAGSSGVQRTINFAKQLPNAGWIPTILTANTRAYESVSDDLLKSIPDKVSVKRAFALDASRHFSFKGKYLGVMALPDRWSSWWLGAVFIGLREIIQKKPSILWSTYPIATAHLICATLHRFSKIPWIADFRDPMVTEAYPVGQLQRKVWKCIEASVVRRAVKCTFTTNRTLELYSERYPGCKDKFMVIENGFDEDAFEGNSPLREDVEPHQYLFLHSGVIYPKERDPTPFFLALRQLIDEGTVQRAQIRIRFRAPRHEEEILGAALQAGVEDLVEVCAPIPYRLAIAEMLGADILLLFQGKGFDTQIPAKLYEYLRAGRPILALAGRGGDTWKMLEGLSSGRCADIEDPKDIEAELKRCLHDLASRDSPNLGSLDWMMRYSRKHGAWQLIQAMNTAKT